MDNFNLKKYLVENKVTRNSQMLNEAKTYTIDVNTADTDLEDSFEVYQDTVNDYLTLPVPDLQESGVNFEALAALVGKYGTLLFEVETVGLDPSVDGIESFYQVKDRNILSEIAKIYAESEELYELSDEIQQGNYTGFVVVTYDYIDEPVVVPLNSGFQEIENQIPTP